MPEVTGLLESALYVDDLERSYRFYHDLFGFEKLLEDDRLCALNVAGRQVLLLFKKGASDQPNPTPGGVIPAHDGPGRLHVAFSIDADAVEAWEARLARKGVAVEARVRPPQGGMSLYLRDPDGHLLELATPGLWAIY